ncbi:unnamed protein product [Rhizophagus irregularis]|nr:unnamed protein product [Rhizophagus irregularis]
MRKVIEYYRSKLKQKDLKKVLDQDKAQTILDDWKNWTTTRKSTKRPSEVKIGRLQVKKVKNIATATGGAIQFVDNNVVHSQCVDGSDDDFQPIRTIQPKRKNISSKKAEPTNERNTKTSLSSPSLVTPIQVKSVFEPISSNIIDTTNNHLMKRLNINRNYHLWVPIVNDATEYIDQLIDNSDTRDKFRRKPQLPFIPPEEPYSFNKHYEKNWVHCFANKLLSFFEVPRNPLLDNNSEEVQIHRGEEMSFASIERKNLSREESERKQYGHKIDILFRIDDTEYFGSETYVDEDPQNSKPISYKQKLFREMKDQLDRLLKKLNFTRETVREIKNITIHGINQGGLNGKIYAMYYDIDLQYYFAFETCRCRIVQKLIFSNPKIN